MTRLHGLKMTCWFRKKTLKEKIKFYFTVKKSNFKTLKLQEKIIRFAPVLTVVKLYKSQTKK